MPIWYGDMGMKYTLINGVGMLIKVGMKEEPWESLWVNEIDK
jgi:hypothetical protein